jgi:hypothetical protein
MKLTIRITTITFMLGCALALGYSAAAQQSAQIAPARIATYSVAREVSLVGTVVKYEKVSNTPPMGAHVLMQTSAGQVDVHLGNAKLLQTNHFELNAGDSIRIVGENLAYGDGNIFSARIVQKGAQAVALRNSRGALLTPASTLTPEQIQALRGVR